jgi:hypothetical protein
VDNTNTEEKRANIPPVSLCSRIPGFKRVKIFRDRVLHRYFHAYITSVVFNLGHSKIFQAVCENILSKRLGFESVLSLAFTKILPCIEASASQK